MELQYYGANCIKITTKAATFVIDDNLVDLGKKVNIKPKDVSLFTTKSAGLDVDGIGFVINSAGEYEVSNASIVGITSRSHMAEDPKDKSSVVYKFVYDDVRICIVGHIYPDLSENQLETIGTVDILIIPVGGNGYTLDPVGAAKLIRKIEPKMIIPTHFDSKDVKYEVPQRTLEDAIRELGIEARPEVDKLKFKSGEMFEGVICIQPLIEQK